MSCTDEVSPYHRLEWEKLHLSHPVWSCLGREEGIECPSQLKKGLFTVAAVDNFDHNPSSTTSNQHWCIPWHRCISLSNDYSRAGRWNKDIFDNLSECRNSRGTSRRASNISLSIDLLLPTDNFQFLFIFIFYFYFKWQIYIFAEYFQIAPYFLVPLFVYHLVSYVVSTRAQRPCSGRRRAYFYLM